MDDPELLSLECVESLDELEPCGNGNPRPVLYMEGAAVEQITPIGGGTPLRLRVSKFGESYDCVFFSQTLQKLDVRTGQTADLVFIPQVNDFRSRRSVQLVITDIRLHRDAE